MDILGVPALSSSQPNQITRNILERQWLHHALAKAHQSCRAHHVADPLHRLSRLSPFSFLSGLALHNRRVAEGRPVRKGLGLGDVSSVANLSKN